MSNTGSPFRSLSLVMVALRWRDVAGRGRELQVGRREIRKVEKRRERERADSFAFFVRRLGSMMGGMGNNDGSYADGYEDGADDGGGDMGDGGGE